MAQTQEPSPKKVSPKKKAPKKETYSITPEEAAEFKGRIPSGIKDQVMAINEEKRQEKKALIKKNSAGALVQQRKLDAFLEEFLKNGGNATKAAEAVFNVTSKASAATVGSYYLKKAKILGRVYLEEKGYGYGRLLTIAANKAEMSRLPDWWDRVMGIAGYDNPGISAKGFQAPTTNVNIIQAEKDIFKKYTMTEGDIVDEVGEEPEESKNFEAEEEDGN